MSERRSEVVESVDTKLREASWSRTIRLCWTCDNQVNELDARTQDLGWGIVGDPTDPNDILFWECAECNEPTDDELL